MVAPARTDCPPLMTMGHCSDGTAAPDRHDELDGSGEEGPGPEHEESLPDGGEGGDDHPVVVARPRPRLTALTRSVEPVPARRRSRSVAMTSHRG